MTKNQALHIAHDNLGYYIAKEGECYVDVSYPTSMAARKALQVLLNEQAQDRRDANIIDGYNCDDLGESYD